MDGETDDLQLTGHEFSEYVEYHASILTPADLKDLKARLPEIRKRFPDIKAPEFPRAARQLEFLADLVEIFPEDGAQDVPFEAFLEAAVALSYLDSEANLVPDLVPGLGFLDDAAMVNIVIERNARALEEYAAQRGIIWSEVDGTLESDEDLA